MLAQCQMEIVTCIVRPEAYLRDLSPPKHLRSNLIWLLQLVCSRHAFKEGQRCRSKSAAQIMSNAMQSAVLEVKILFTQNWRTMKLEQEKKGRTNGRLEVVVQEELVHSRFPVSRLGIAHRTRRCPLEVEICLASQVIGYSLSSFRPPTLFTLPPLRIFNIEATHSMHSK